VLRIPLLSVSPARKAAPQPRWRSPATGSAGQRLDCEGDLMADLGHLPGHLLQRLHQADCGEGLNLGVVRMRRCNSWTHS
jgi:hypothetical protein